MLLLHYLLVGLQFWLVATVSGTNFPRWQTEFVSIQDGSFQLNGKHVALHITLHQPANLHRRPFRFYGTNAYWLHMTTDADMDFTLHNIAAVNFSVVRTWAFNDVASVPASGPYFQVLNIQHVVPQYFLIDVLGPARWWQCDN